MLLLFYVLHKLTLIKPNTLKLIDSLATYDIVEHTHINLETAIKYLSI